MDDSAQEFNKRELKKARKEEEKKKEKRVNTSKNLIVILGIIGAVILVGYGLVRLSDPETSFSPPLVEQVQPDDNIKGPQEAQVTIVEYGDYQCPGCAAYSPIVNESLSRFDGKVRVVFRHFPLTGHSNALPAAYAAEAAGLQGKFWEMNDLLYARQNEWSTQSDPIPTLESYATSLELDIEKFKQDFQSDIVKDKVESDLQSGLESQVNATPTFYINGEKVERLPNSAQAFFDLIEAELSQ